MNLRFFFFVVFSQGVEYRLLCVAVVVGVEILKCQNKKKKGKKKGNKKKIPWH